MAEKLDLDALERANLGRVVRPEDWMALLAYARTLEVDAQRYGFLRNRARSVDWSTSHEAEGCTITARFCRVRPVEMDQNIDDAMKRSGEQKA